LLSLPPELMGDKLSIMLSSLNLVAGLMLTGVMVSGLSPTESASYNDPDLEFLNNIRNLLSAILISLNVNVVLFTTYLICQLAVEPPQNILRVVSRGGGLVLYQIWTFTSGIIVLVLLSITTYLNSTGIWRWASVIAVPIILALAMSHFFLNLGQMFPLIMVRWATSVCPIFLWTKRGQELKEAARRDKVRKQRGVLKHLGIDGHPDLAKMKTIPEECVIATKMIDASSGGGGGSEKHDKKQLIELKIYLRKALQDDGQNKITTTTTSSSNGSSTLNDRLHSICNALLKEDLNMSTLKTLYSVSNEEGKGAHALMQVLSEVEGISLSVGEKIKIARSFDEVKHDSSEKVLVTDCGDDPDCS